MNETSQDTLRLGLPKGRMKEGVHKLLADAGVHVRMGGARNYRPQVSLEGVEAKLLKPQDIVNMLHVGSRDVGFAGADWVTEMGAEVVELLDTRMDPVQLVAAAPIQLLDNDKLPKRHLVVASEYEQLTRAWIQKNGLDASFVRSFGATEVFPPEDADCIVDNTATGSTLRANQLQIVDTLMISSTRLYAYPKAMENPVKRARIEHLLLLLRSVLEARQRVMLEINIGAERLQELLTFLPCMKQPTIASLHGEGSLSVKVAVQRSALPSLLPRLKEVGGTDVIVTQPTQIVL